MKKLFLMLAVAMMTASVSAQNTAVTANKAGDNWYIGINAGVATPVMKIGDYGFMKGVSPEFGFRLGKNLTTVFGLALDINNYFGNKSDSKSMFGSKTFINATDFDILSTWNLSNAFAGYKGEPRSFEVIGLIGGGYSRAWAEKQGGINAKAALDFAFNLGAAKQWQLYIEPGIVFGQPYVRYANPFRKIETVAGKKFNGALSVKVGLNYKFGTSNGTHNYKIAELRDQAEIDGLNAKINELRANLNDKDALLAAKDAQIRDLQAALDACNNRPTEPVYVKPATATNLQPTVLFRKGKSTIDAAQYAPIELIASYMKNHPDAKVEIKGYASPEGSLELNQKLSEDRANAVMKALIKKYKISADRLSAIGCGPTDQLFEELEFNRVATFNDMAK